jgi:hypothetical protein
LSKPILLNIQQSGILLAHVSYWREAMHTLLTSIAGVSTQLRSLYYHWLDASKDGLPPSLDGLDLHRLNNGMDNIVLTEVLFHSDGTAWDFRHLYIGRTLGAHLEGDRKGRLLSDKPERGPNSQIWDAYAAIVVDPRPRLVKLPYEGHNPAYASTFEVFLPLRDDAGTPRYILVGVEFVPVDPDPRQHPQD